MACLDPSLDECMFPSGSCADCSVVVVQGAPVTHGVECYEAWRYGADCPHERSA